MATDKQPWVSVYVRFTRKGPGRAALRLLREDWNFGKEEFFPLDSLIVGFVHRLVEFYAASMPISSEDIDAAIKKAGKYISEMEMEET